MVQLLQVLSGYTTFPVQELLSLEFLLYGASWSEQMECFI